ncbi:oligosaccharide flippase family protein [Bradyrhizobium sp. 76]|uniref:oligosaccharide flippase family protein n=1 Tax=Bradyrhizobium sp. 76 TaxID=2782680 RepID=UPI001FFB1BF7|nr:oligosaccharide flippase family protein [Bradyrhizobium sp. 76]MCK1404937.1 oligosaccharide flippase family protein [Bradyrhizobium sp. 76]
MKARALQTNFVINVFGAIVPLAISLVTVPIYIRHIGEARYGILSIVWVMLGYLGFLDLGLSRAAANALARLRNAPQEARARVLVTTLLLNLGLGLFGGLCLAIFGSYLLQHLLTMPEALQPEIVEAFPWIVGLFPLALLSGVGIGALESRERFLLANVLQISGSSLGQIAPVVVAVMHSPSLAVVVPIAAIARALTAAAILIAVYRDEGPLSLVDFDRHQVKKLLSYGGWISVSGIISPILSSLDQLVIGSVLNVSAVTHYAVPMTLVTRSQIFASALSRTLFPRMSSVEPEEARSLASRALLLLAYGYGALCAPAIILTPIFFQHWIGTDFSEVATPVAEILFLGAWINGLAFVPYGLLQSQGRPDITGKFHAAEILPFLGILWALTSAYGINGAAMAWSLRCAVDAACLFWAAAIPRRALLQAIVLPLCLLVGSHVVVRYLGSDLWVSFAVATAAALVGIVLALINSMDFRRATFTLTLRALRLISTRHGSLLAEKFDTLK